MKQAQAGSASVAAAWNTRRFTGPCTLQISACLVGRVGQATLKPASNFTAGAAQALRRCWPNVGRERARTSPFPHWERSTTQLLQRKGLAGAVAGKSVGRKGGARQFWRIGSADQRERTQRRIPRSWAMVHSGPSDRGQPRAGSLGGHGHRWCPARPGHLGLRGARGQDHPHHRVLAKAVCRARPSGPSRRAPAVNQGNQPPSRSALSLSGTNRAGPGAAPAACTEAVLVSRL